jgi:ABC-type Mn2+/Zn2+ transport system ATPase subunit
MRREPPVPEGARRDSPESASPLDCTRPEPRDGVLLRAEGVGVVLEGRQILQDVHLEVYAGEVLALIGPNGAGKTTLIRVLLGLIKPDAGTMTWFDSSGTGHAEPRQAAGYVPQRIRADLRYPLTVCEVVGMTLRRGRPLWARFNRNDHDMVHQALDRLGIRHLADRFVGRLSGGQQQRLFLARALVHEPDLLILDEPTTGIDARGRDEVLTLITQIRSEGTGVVLATHEDRHLTELADRVCRIDGTLCQVSKAEIHGHVESLPRGPAPRE